MKKLIQIGIMLLIAAALTLCVGIFCFRDLQVTQYRAALDGIQEEVRIVLISDLHEQEFGENNEQLLKLVKAQQPDLIAFPGDLISRDASDAEVETACAFMEQLTAIAPTYYSLGNHEQIYIKNHGDAILDRISQTGATVLDDAYLDLTVNGSTFRLGGMDRYAYRDGGGKFFPGAEEFLTDYLDTELPTVLLSHRPESFSFKSACLEWDVDLILSGHTHGGLIRLPFVGGLVAPIQGFFPKTVYGEYNFFDSKIIVTSGLAGYSWVPRVFNPPEICVVTLCKP